MGKILVKLAGGDRRSIGRVEEVISDILANPSDFAELFQGLSHKDEVIRMRAADAIEKISRQNPEFIKPFKEEILHQISQIEQQEVRWHWAQMVPRLELNREERQQVVDVLISFLDDPSRIVNTFAMQSLADLALEDPDLRPTILPILEEKTSSGSPAMKSRGRKLLRLLGEGQKKDEG